MAWAGFDTCRRDVASRSELLMGSCDESDAEGPNSRVEQHSAGAASLCDVVELQPRSDYRGYGSMG